MSCTHWTHWFENKALPSRPMAMLLSYSIFCKWSGVFFPQHPYVPVKIWSLFPNAFSNWTPLRLSQNLTLPKIPLDSLLKKITHFGCILGHPMPHTRQKPTEKGLRVGEWNAHPNPGQEPSTLSQLRGPKEKWSFAHPSVYGIGTQRNKRLFIPLMAEVLHHRGCKKSLYVMR